MLTQVTTDRAPNLSPVVPPPSFDSTDDATPAKLLSFYLLIPLILIVGPNTSPCSPSLPNQSHAKHSYLDLLSGQSGDPNHRHRPLSCYVPRENVVADALSRNEPREEDLIALTVFKPVWAEELKGSYEGDELVQGVVTECLSFPLNMSLYSYTGGLVRYKGKLYIGVANQWRKRVLEFVHSSAMGGHLEVNATYQKLKGVFWWPKMKEEVHSFVTQCHTCQISKHELLKMPSLLQPLPVPQQAWVYISMDFIEKLPKSQGKDTIWVVVDRFTKFSHFIPLSHPFNASQLAQLFIDSVYKLHGLPHTIVSDRDNIFTSGFWHQLLKALGVQQLLSTAYHPQTDG